MKILLANKFFYLKGGAEVYFFETAKLLENKGHKVIFFSMRHPRNFSTEYEKYFVSNVDYDNNAIRNKINASLKLLYSFEARRKIKNLIKERPNIAHLNNIYHQISPSIIPSLKKFNIPIVMTLHDFKVVCASYSMIEHNKVCEACKGGKYFNCLLKSCVKDSKLKSSLCTIEMYLHHKILDVYNLIDIFISPSKFLKNKVEEMGFKGKIVYLPNFVNTNDFKPDYNWQKNSIVYFGRLSKDKGLLTLIEAVKNIEGIVLKIIGEGPIEEDLKLKVKSKKLNNIHLLGYKTGRALHNEIRSSMFVVLPSELYENNPLTIIEGFALGKPAVGAQIGGIPELVRDGETGLTFEPGNVENLRGKLLQLFKNPAEIIRMGKNARKMIEENFNSEIHYEKLMKIYKSVING